MTDIYEESIFAEIKLHESCNYDWCQLVTVTICLSISTFVSTHRAELCKLKLNKIQRQMLKFDFWSHKEKVQKRNVNPFCSQRKKKVDMTRKGITEQWKQYWRRVTKDLGSCRKGNGWMITHALQRLQPWLNRCHLSVERS